MMREDWVKSQLIELSTFELGGDWGKAPNYENSEFIQVYCIRGSEFRNWDEKKGKTASSRKIKKTSLEKRKLQENDILVEISGGGPEQPVGRTVVIDKSVLNNFNTQNVIYTNFLRLIRPSQLVNSQFINYYLKFFYSTGEIINYQAGSNNLRNLKFKDYLTISIPLPPLPIQRSIVNKIENLFASLDKGISDLKKAQEQLKAYRQAVLKKAFEGRFVNDCSNWENIDISSLCDVVRGGSPRPAGSSIYYNGNIPFLKVADLTRNNGTHLKTFTYTIKEAGLKKTRLVKENTLLISNSGATLGIPKICSFETTFNDGIAAFLGLEKDSLLYHYYFWLSKTKELRNINQGAAQPNLNTKMIGAIKIPLGNMKDQIQTVKEIESRLSVCDKIEQSITEGLEKSEALRQSILKKAFEGKLLSDAEIEKCKQEADYEPASVLLERIKKDQKK